METNSDRLIGSNSSNGNYGLFLRSVSMALGSMEKVEKTSRKICKELIDRTEVQNQYKKKSLPRRNYSYLSTCAACILDTRQAG